MCVLELVVGIVDASRLALEVVAKSASMSARHPLQVLTKEERVIRVVHKLLATWSSSTRGSELAGDMELASNFKWLLARMYGLGHMWLCSSLVYAIGCS